MMPPYTTRHAQAGTRATLPAIACWPNQYPDYEITIEVLEFASVCPRTGLPDYGKITLRYLPHKRCVELKSLKLYITAFRTLGIFQENAVNRILDDVVKAAKPRWAVVTGEFNPRGGMRTIIEAQFPRRPTRRRQRGLRAVAEQLVVV